MKIRINLSSEPFRRDRPIIVASATVASMLVVLLVVLTWLAVAERNRAKEARVELAKVDARLRALNTEQNKLEAVLQNPQDAAVLDRSIFLNLLLLRKGVSWTRIFADLEKVVPYNVRLVSIRPQLNGPNDLLLEMVLGAQSPEPVIDLLMKMESSPIFGNTTMHTSQPPTQNDPLYKFRVSVNYAQKL
jgi:Tfp pilus assembly protein PilN